MNIHEYFNYYMQESLEVIYYHIKAFFNIELVSSFAKECCNMEEFVNILKGLRKWSGWENIFITLITAHTWVSS